MKHNLKLFLFAILMMNTNLQAQQPEEAYANGSYSVTYVTYGGTNAPSNPTTYSSTGTDVTLLPATKPNLVFGGWFASPRFEMDQKVTELPGDFAGVTKLYARWSPDHPILTYEDNGGDALAEVVLQPAYPFASSFPVATSKLAVDMDWVRESLSGDFNEDGYGDTLFFPLTGQKRVIVWGSSTGVLTKTEYPGLYPHVPRDSEYFDADGDGIRDIVMTNPVFDSNIPQILWWKGTGVGTFATEAVLPTATTVNFPAEVSSIDYGDINEDGIVDIVYGGYGSIGYILGLGNGTFGAYTQINFTNFSNWAGNYNNHILLEDMNNDGLEDLIFHFREMMYIMPKTAGQMFSGAAYLFDFMTYSGFAADLNQDGMKEYISKSPSNSNLYSYTFNSTLTSATKNDLGYVGNYFYGDVFDLDVMDVNGDGILDPSYAITGNDQAWILVSKKLANGTFIYQGHSMFGNIYQGSILYNSVDGSFGLSGFDFFNREVNHHYTSKNYTNALFDLRNVTTQRTGYTFQGWHSDVALQSPVIWNENVTQDKTIYAKWSLNEFNITYVLNGGTNASSNPRFTTILSPSYTLASPTKTNSRFDGWFDNPSFEGQPVTQISASNMNFLTFYAKWTDSKAITFVMNGGPAVPSLYAIPGFAITAPANPSRPGYVFEGWFTSNAFAEPFVFSTMPVNGASAFAKWRALPFTLSFITNGAASIDSVIFTTDANLVLPSNPTKVGYTFAGWFTNSELTTPFTARRMLPFDVTLYAKWSVNGHQFSFTIEEETTILDVDYDTLLASLLPTPTLYQYEFLGWSIDGETLVNLSTFKMPDNDLSIIALFKDNVDPVVFTLTDGDTYAGGVDIIFNEGTALLDGQLVQSGYRVQAAGTYTLVVTDNGGNVVEVTFTVIEAVDNSNLRWIIFASILGGTWLFLAILYLFNRQSTSGGSSGGGSLAMNKKAPKPVAVIHKKTVKEQQPVEKPTVVKTEVAPSLIVPQESTPKQVVETKKPEVTKPVEVKKPESKVDKKQTEPKVEVKKPLNKVPPLPIIKPEEIDQQVTEAVIFKKPLKIVVDPVESFKPELKTEFDEVFVSDKRKVKVPELTYIPQSTNIPFYSNLFRYIHRFAGVLSEGLLGNLTQSVIKLTDDKEAQLKIVEASTRTAEGLKTNQNQDYLLKILRRNVALNRDVLNPRNKYVYSYQRLATLLEELSIYGEAVIVAREAYERGLVDTPEATFEKRLSRLEKKLIASGGQRQDMLRK